MIKRRVIQCEAGYTVPQVQIQIVPFCWGLAFSIAHNCGGFQLGPLSVMFWWRAGNWEAYCKNDFRKVDNADR